MHTYTHAYIHACIHTYIHACAQAESMLSKTTAHVQASKSDPFMARTPEEKKVISIQM